MISEIEATMANTVAANYYQKNRARLLELARIYRERNREEINRKQRDTYKREYADMTKVQAELTRRAAEDCVVTPVPGGYRCVELRTGRVFIVKQ